MATLKTFLKEAFVLTLLMMCVFTVNAVNLSTNVTYYVENVTISSKVWLNDYVSGYVFLVDSNNMTLNGVSCSVVAIENESHTLTKIWDVSCRDGEPYVDTDGNWVVISKTCKISGADGFYYFKGNVLEDDGFQAGRYYDLKFTCYGASNSSAFYVDVPKPADISARFTFARRYLGLIILWLIVFIFIFILIYLIRRGVIKF
jgi:hypothetical protein